MLLPLLMALALILLNFSELWHSGTNTLPSAIITKFNDILSNFTLNEDFTMPLKYLFTNIFELNTTLSTSLSNYIMYLVMIELVHVLYDLIIFLPRFIRSLIDKGVKD